MGCKKTHLSFRVLSEEITPAEISELLKIEPTNITEIDQNSKYKNRNEFHVWSLSTKNILKSKQNSEHIQFVIDKLAGKEKELKHLRENNCTTDIYSYWESTGSQGGPVLEVDLMNSLVTLGIDIAWDIYVE